MFSAAAAAEKSWAAKVEPVIVPAVPPLSVPAQTAVVVSDVQPVARSELHVSTHDPCVPRAPTLQLFLRITKSCMQIQMH